MYRREVVSFARRVGKSLRASQANLIENFLPEVSAQVPEDLAPLSNANEFFTGKRDYKKIVLEVGFGGGEHVFELAKANPDVGYIASEPFMNGVASLLKKIKDENINNIAVWSDDVNYLLPRMPTDSIDEVYILFPDPWPKKKHHKRRIVNQKMLEKLSRIMKKSAKIFVATDHTEYASWILEELIKNEDFLPIQREENNWRVFPNDWVETRYQRKAKEKGIDSFLFEFKSA